MSQINTNHDFISERDFTLRRKHITSDPQEDSPGDSEQDSGAEFSFGMYYEPSGTEIDELEDSIENENVPMQRPEGFKLHSAVGKFRIPISSMVTASELPSPRQDRDRESSTN